MADRPSLTLEENIAAAQAWWREAGIDLAFHDEPAGWLAPDVPSAASEPARLPPKREQASAPGHTPLGGDPATWPGELAAFREWWLSEPSLDEGGLHPRVAPRGAAGARLLVLVPMPEAEDGDRLLGGAQGRLLTSFALAAGLTSEQVYFAAALPRHTPMPDWERLAERGLGEIVRHHIALANPDRILVLGSGILPLLGHDPAQAPPTVSEIDIHGRQKPMLATFAPERLLGNARQRAGLWQRWLEWTDSDA